MRKKYNTPHRSRVVKTRLTEDEYADFTARLAPYGISQSEFLRQAIRRTTIRPVLHVSSVNDELLSAVGKLAAEYGRIGGNLNQIARYLNEYGAPYHALSGEVRAAISTSIFTTSFRPSFAIVVGLSPVSCNKSFFFIFRSAKMSHNLSYFTAIDFTS